MDVEACLSSRDLVALLDGELGEHVASFRDHVRVCASCAELVSCLVDEEGAGPTPAPLSPGTRVGGLVVEGVVGAGSFGIIYRARDELAAREVALKVLEGGPATGDERFLAELRHLARVRHPHVAGVFGAERLPDGRAALVLELVRGHTLATAKAGDGSWRDTLALFLEAADGLAAIHEAGVVHGDFKPENVLVDERGRAVIIDFGLSRAFGDEGTSVAAAGGTPAYVAPEVITRGVVDPRSDQYAFAVSLLEALGGSRPTWSGGHLAPLDVGEAPAALVAVARRALEPDPARRYPSMRDLARALRAEVALVGRVRMNAGFASAGFALVSLVLLGGHPLGARPALVVGALASAAVLAVLAALGHRSALVARFCRAAGAPALLFLIAGLIPVAAAVAGPSAAFSSFVVAELLTVAIVLPALSGRGGLSIVVGLVAGAVYALVRLGLGDAAATSWANVGLRAGLLSFTGLLAWMLASRRLRDDQR